MEWNAKGQRYFSFIHKTTLRNLTTKQADSARRPNRFFLELFFHRLILEKSVVKNCTPMNAPLVLLARFLGSTQLRSFSFQFCFPIFRIDTARQNDHWSFRCMLCGCYHAFSIIIQIDMRQSTTSPGLLPGLPNVTGL